MPDVDLYRLPRTVVPSRYELTLEPDLGTASFSGEERVEVEVVEPVTEIVCNAIELEIDDAWVEAAGERIEVTVTYDKDEERAVLTLARTLQKGPASVHTRFRGVLNERLKGFYRSTFVDDDGVEHVIATTQFESTDARRAFPCWDEPDAKAVFSITLVVDERLTALSNTSEVSSEPRGDGRKVVRFADTMVMSTYLVAFIVGPLDVTAPVDVDGTPLRVAYPRGKGRLTPFALESGAFALRHFQEYFGLPYPGDKLDLVAVPDFAFGAMENLGCVTFRETVLLVDPERATQAELQRVAQVIHHEIAHMWFGDLVTMRWWNGIWLNEAFATFMEIRCTDAFRPEWGAWNDFAISRSAAFDTDALVSTRPIEFPVVSPQEAEGMFDILTYEKGAGVVRMLEQYLGEDEFRSGIRRYMQQHQYGNTETTDLWDAIEEATGEPVRRIMDTWIFQGGHPVVSVELTDDGRALRLTQHPHHALAERAGSDGTPEGAGGPDPWAIPVLVRYGPEGEGDGARTVRVLLDGDAATVDLDATAGWVVVNSGGSGFFRVHYPAELRAALTRRAQQELTPLERYNLVDDAWASVLAGTTTSTEFCALARSFADETDLNVWQRVVGALSTLDRILPAPSRASFAGWVRALVGPALLRLGEAGAGEPDRTSALRAELFGALGALGQDEAVQAQARSIVAGDAAASDPNLFDAAVRVVAASGDESTLVDYLARSKAAPTPQDVLRYLAALCELPDVDLLTRFVELTLTPDIRTQDAPYLLRRALHHRDHHGAVWAFVRTNWATINERFPSNSVPRLLDGIRSVNDPALAADVEAFIAEHPVPQGTKAVRQHLERMRVSVALAERERAALVATMA